MTRKKIILNNDSKTLHIKFKNKTEMTKIAIIADTVFDILASGRRHYFKTISMITRREATR